MLRFCRTGRGRLSTVSCVWLYKAGGGRLSTVLCVRFHTSQGGTGQLYRPLCWPPCVWFYIEFRMALRGGHGVTRGQCQIPPPPCRKSNSLTCGVEKKNRVRTLGGTRKNVVEVKASRRLCFWHVKHTDIPD